jgi:hypothetical protein
MDGLCVTGPVTAPPRLSLRLVTASEPEGPPWHRRAVRTQARIILSIENQAMPVQNRPIKSPHCHCEGTVRPAAAGRGRFQFGPSLRVALAGAGLLVYGDSTLRDKECSPGHGTVMRSTNNLTQNAGTYVVQSLVLNGFWCVSYIDMMISERAQNPLTCPQLFLIAATKHFCL